MEEDTMRRLILLALLLALGLATAGCGEKSEEPNQMKGSFKDRMKKAKMPPKGR